MNAWKRIIGIANAPYISTLVMATYTLVYFFSTLAFVLNVKQQLMIQFLSTHPKFKLYIQPIMQKLTRRRHSDGIQWSLYANVSNKAIEGNYELGVG